ncbi:rhamnogalacturonan acetylesterase [Fusibacter sp. 3D3]|uniref:rhamnogalacturonan acetylesterase n=1 Tax=Fusibacter sp. 3D3 TaxID=1048380 RepID=UPI000853E126|nr:rhamnogalacturonan acetylesterase [Fusibacter sp. 3D3]GAU75735.1 rhamnogalacturonan acetylesterase [Fusibacter sp. 3D3]
MKIYLIGDSTLQYNNIKTYPQMGWGQVLHLYVEPQIEICNHAKNGTSSKSFFETGLFEPVAESMTSGDLLLIQFGHNDQKEDEARKTDAHTTYKIFLTHYIEVARSKGAIPILITPLCRRHFKEGALKVGIHLDFPEAMIELSKALEVPLIDLYVESRQRIEYYGEEDSKALYLHLSPKQYERAPEGLEDNSHLSMKGAVEFAGIIANGLKRIGYDFVI